MSDPEIYGAKNHLISSQVERAQGTARVVTFMEWLELRGGRPTPRRFTEQEEFALEAWNYAWAAATAQSEGEK
jgi:hypothetical protein